MASEFPERISDDNGGYHAVTPDFIASLRRNHGSYLAGKVDAISGRKPKVPAGSLAAFAYELGRRESSESP